MPCAPPDRPLRIGARRACIPDCGDRTTSRTACAAAVSPNWAFPYSRVRVRNNPDGIVIGQATGPVATGPAGPRRTHPHRATRAPLLETAS